ncbi:MAG: cupin domain-containing protein [Candidatus Promineifilaceae bacterium]|nr:cupin domain-containing protein [Candidatus Promineifilaceae bacterium]
MTTKQKEKQRILDFDGFPGRWEIQKSAAETDRERFQTRMVIEEAGQLPAHRHPSAEESYEVLSGSLEVQVEGEWTTLSAGEKHTVPAGTIHSFKVSQPVEMINVHQPALRYEEYFRRFQKLKVERGVEMPPKRPKGMILLGMLQVEYEREFIATSPPQWLFRILARLGRLLGYELPK